MAINFPSTPANGATYFAEGRAWIYDSTLGKWRASRFMPVEAAATAPAGQEGKLWFDTNDGSLNIYYGSAWVEVSSLSLPSDVLTAADIGVAVQAYNANILRAADLGEAVGIAPTLGSVQAMTSGTSKELTSLPANVRRIEIAWAGMSANGAAAKLIQLGTSSGYVITGYGGISSVYGANTGVATNTDGLRIASAAAADVNHGVATLDLVDETNHVWMMQAHCGNSNNANGFTSYANIVLPAVADRVRIITQNGTDTFDAGSINFRYS